MALDLPKAGEHIRLESNPVTWYKLLYNRKPIEYAKPLLENRIFGSLWTRYYVC